MNIFFSPISYQSKVMDGLVSLASGFMRKKRAALSNDSLTPPQFVLRFVLKHYIKKDNDFTGFDAFVQVFIVCSLKNSSNPDISSDLS